MWRFVADFLDNAFCWDNKLFRTLDPLLTRPGAITLDYLSGRRARYVHPLRLFLFTSAICLGIIQYFGGSPTVVHIEDDKKQASKHHGSSFNFHFDTPSAASPSPGRTGTGQPASGSLPVAGAARVASDARPGASSSPAAASATPDAADASPPAATAKAPAKKNADDDDDDDDNPVKGLSDQIGSATAARVQAAVAAAQSRAASPAASAPADESLGDRIDRKARARLKADGGPQRMQKEITEDVKRRVSYVALALLPIFAVMLRSLYWRRDSYYFAHFVFSLHYHTFLLLFFASYTLLLFVLPTSLTPIHALLRLSLLLPGVYLFLALRRIYGESAGRAVAKVFVLGAMHLLALVIGLSVVGAWAAYRALE
jgi:hypothetical protein